MNLKENACVVGCFGKNMLYPASAVSGSSRLAFKQQLAYKYAIEF
jgi:hypothetical protein